MIQNNYIKKLLFVKIFDIIKLYKLVQYIISDYAKDYIKLNPKKP